MQQEVMLIILPMRFHHHWHNGSSFESIMFPILLWVPFPHLHVIILLWFVKVLFNVVMFCWANLNGLWLVDMHTWKRMKTLRRASLWLVLARRQVMVWPNSEKTLRRRSANRWRSYLRWCLNSVYILLHNPSCTYYRLATDMFIEFADGEESNTNKTLWIYQVRTPLSLVTIFLPSVIIQ